MRNQFDTQLNTLHVELIKMGALCEESIAAAMKSILEADATMALRASLTEREIDRKERDIEALCMKLLLQQQPVARDLRAISSALRMISDTYAPELMPNASDATISPLLDEAKMM